MVIIASPKLTKFIKILYLNAHVSLETSTLLPRLNSNAILSGTVSWYNLFQFTIDVYIIIWGKTKPLNSSGHLYEAGRMRRGIKAMWYKVDARGTRCGCDYTLRLIWQLPLQFSSGTIYMPQNRAGWFIICSVSSVTTNVITSVSWMRFKNIMVF